LLVSLGLGLGGNTALAVDETSVGTDQGGGGSSTPVLTPQESLGLTPIIGVDPTSLDFGRVCVGACSDLVVELFNDNEDPSSSLEITALTAAGEGFTLFDPPAVPFSIAGGNPGPRVQVTVRFCAATPGAQSGTFTIEGASSNSPVIVALAGTGNSAPVCDANGPYSAQIGQTITFDGTGSSDPDGTNESYLWEFGDGTSGTGASPTHTYATSGTFNVELTVTDDDGASSGCGTTAEIAPAPNEPPVCDADGPYNGTVNVAVTFDGTGSSDPDGTIASYAWDFGDGSTGTGATPTHAYASPGNFTVTLTVTDNEGASSTCTTTANITETPNEPPLCDANGPYSGTVGQSISFDGSGSSDPDGTIESYAWDFGDGGTGTGATPTHTYAASGNFTVTLTVTDNDGASSTCTTTAEIGSGPTNQPPNCSQARPSVSEIWPGNHQFVRVSVLGVTDPDGDPVTITIDGVTQDEPLSGPGYGNHCPDARPAGTSRVDLRAERGGSGDGRVYEISFTASDGQGGTCSGTVSVCVPKNQSPHNVCVDSGQEFDSFGPCDLPRGGEQVAGELALSASVASGVVLVDYELAQDSSVDLAVFDVTGRRLAVLVKSQQAQGAHTLSWDAKGIARGVYYVRISTPTGNLTKRVVLVR
jgi:PKD repeat protein